MFYYCEDKKLRSIFTKEILKRSDDYKILSICKLKGHSSKLLVSANHRKEGILMMKTCILCDYHFCMKKRSNINGITWWERLDD